MEKGTKQVKKILKQLMLREKGPFVVKTIFAIRIACAVMEYLDNTNFRKLHIHFTHAYIMGMYLRNHCTVITFILDCAESIFGAECS